MDSNSPQSLSKKKTRAEWIAPELARLKVVLVNVYFIGNSDRWILVDAGLAGSADRIKSAAAELFGENSRPDYIVLTHGHFDHVGALETLASDWSVPVYAHPMEFPYLNGHSSYPPPDPTVGGGAMALMSWMFPKNPVDVALHLREFPETNHLPDFEEWRIIHTPGHTPGHVSFFRERDRVLIAGDAFVTTKQESVFSVITQQQELHGPPMYYTSDWEMARYSVERLAELDPVLAATGHGIPMGGEEFQRELVALVNNFDERAIPKSGRYVGHPAISNEQGVISLPPSAVPVGKIIAGIGLAAIAGYAVTKYFQGRDRE